MWRLSPTCRSPATVLRWRQGRGQRSFSSGIVASLVDGLSELALECSSRWVSTSSPAVSNPPQRHNYLLERGRSLLVRLSSRHHTTLPSGTYDRPLGEAQTHMGIQGLKFIDADGLFLSPHDCDLLFAIVKDRSYVCAPFDQSGEFIDFPDAATM